MAEQVTDMFNSAIERDVYYKVRDDVGGTFARVLDNFSTNQGTKGEVVFPAIFALAWVLRSALLVVKSQAGQAAYDAVCRIAIELALSADPGEDDER